MPDIGRAGREGGDQFGMAPPASMYITAGVQMEYGRVTPPTREGYLPPTRTFSGDQLLLTMAGVPLQLLYTPGETADAISVWLPDKRVLMPGDDFLRGFPNISPIRGARPRTPEDWIASLEKMIELGPRSTPSRETTTCHRLCTCCGIFHRNEAWYAPIHCWRSIESSPGALTITDHFGIATSPEQVYCLPM